jgi:predicted site-specific integrase-resolvase
VAKQLPSRREVRWRRRLKQKERRVALYLRVSTSEQTTRNQRRDLEAVTERHGWLVVSAFEDAGMIAITSRIGASTSNSARRMLTIVRLCTGRELEWSTEAD